MKPYHYYSTTLQLVYKKKPVSKSEHRYAAGICNGKKKCLYTYGHKVYVIIMKGKKEDGKSRDSFEYR